MTTLPKWSIHKDNVPLARLGCHGWCSRASNTWQGGRDGGKRRVLLSYRVAGSGFLHLSFVCALLFSRTALGARQHNAAFHSELNANANTPLYYSHRSTFNTQNKNQTDWGNHIWKIAVLRCIGDSTTPHCKSMVYFTKHTRIKSDRVCYNQVIFTMFSPHASKTKTCLRLHFTLKSKGKKTLDFKACI